MAAKYFSSSETTNFARLSRLVVDVCSDVLRAVLKAAIPPPGLKAILQSQRVHLRRNLDHRQQQFLYPPGGVFTGTLEDLDFTLLYRLIRNLQGINIPPHTKGWGRTPDNTDRSLAANIDRLRIQRNETHGHLPRASLSDTGFHCISVIIRQCISEIEQGSLTGDTYVTAVDNLLTVTMDPDTENEYIEKLRKQQEDFEVIVEDMKDRHENMALGISDLTSRVETIATGISDNIATVETIVTNLTDVTERQDTISTDITQLTAVVETITTEISGVTSRQETMAVGISDVTTRQETMAVGISDVTTRQETMAVEISDVTSRQETMAVDISDVTSRQETMAVEISDVATRQETMAVEISDVATRQETMARDKDRHPKIAALIETTRVMIKEEMKKGFIATKGYHDAREKLRMNRIVVIKGNIGDGKTSTAIQLLHWLVEEQNRQSVQLHNIKDLDLLAPNSKTAIFIDDIFGGKDLREKNVQEWNKRMKSVIPKIGGDDQTQANFLVITVRNEVFNSLNKCSLERVFTDQNIIDLSSSTYKVAEEKIKLLEFYKPEDFCWTKEEKEYIVFCAPSVGFPQCCRLFMDIPDLQKERVKFFENPFIFLSETLSRFRECPALLFLFLNSGLIIVKDLDPYSDKVNKTMLEEAFEINLVSGEDDRTTMTYKKKVEYVKESLQRLLGVLVRKEHWSGDDVYRFDHDSIYVTVALLYGNKTPVGFIMNCPSIFLSYITTSKTSSNMIVISSDHYTHMCERLLEIVLKGNVMGSLGVWKDPVFFKAFDKLVNEKKTDKQNLFNKVCHSGASEYALYLLHHESIKPDSDTPWWSLITRGEFCGQGDVDVLEKVARCLNDEMKLNLFYKLCISGSVECALYLLREGVEPGEDTDWWSLITRGDLCRKGDVNVLKKVARYLKDEMKPYLLKEACQSGSKECALYLLNEGVKPDKYTPWWPLITRGKWYGKGDLDVLKEIFNRYLNCETKVDLLNKSCYYGSEECALYLLGKRVKPDKDTPFLSVEGRCLNVLKEVMNGMNDEIKADLLEKACSSASVECALYLLSKGVKPEKDMPLSSLIGRDLDVLKRVVKYLNDEIKLALLNMLCSDGSEECALYLLCEGVKHDENTPVCAMGRGCMNVLKNIMSNLNDEGKLDLLNEACRFGSVECTLYLLREGVKLDKDIPWLPLIWKCLRWKKNLDVLKKIIAFMNNEVKLDLLNKACLDGSEECVSYLLCEGAKPDENTAWDVYIKLCLKQRKRDVDTLKKVVIYLNDEMKLCCLNTACLFGAEDFALYLLREGAKPDKNTPFCVAKGGSVTLLKEIGLNDAIGRDVLYTACSYGSVECALYLLREGVQPHKETPWWSLITGGGRHVKADVDVLKKVLRYMTVEIKLNMLNKTCDTGSKECALYLLREGVEPKKVTPLWSLITSDVNQGKGDVNVLKKVIQYLNGDIALDLFNKACDSGSEECALYLLSENVKPDKKTPFCVAEGGSLNVLKKVLDNVNDDIKLSLLKTACLNASKECVIYLLSQGIKPDIDVPFSSLIYNDALQEECLDIIKTIIIYLNDEMKLQLLNDACSFYSEECGLFLLCEGVKPDKNTPFFAVKGGCVRVLKKVVKGLKSEIKLAIFSESCSSCEVECALYMLSEGVKPDEDIAAWQSLTRRGNWNIEQVERGFIYLDNEGRLDLLNNACASGSEAIALYLLRAGVTPDKNTLWWSLITRNDEDGKGDVNVLKKVVKHLNDEIKLDLLNKACRSGSEECALCLLCEGVKPDKDTALWSLLTRGDWYRKGDLVVLKKVVKHLDNAMKLDLLNKACCSGSEDCALYLLCEGVKPDKDTALWSLITRGDEDGKGHVHVLRKIVLHLNDEMLFSLLQKACSSGSTKSALYLLCEGVKPDKSTTFLAASGGCVKVLKKVVSELKIEIKPAVLNEACSSGAIESVLYLLSEGVKPDQNTPWSSLIKGKLRQDDVDVLKKVVSYLNDEIKLDLFNKTCDSGSVECALYLLHEGVKPDRYTAFNVVKGNCLNVLKDVMPYLNNETKVDILNKACCFGSEECALFLLCEGVEPDKDTSFCVVEGKSVNLLKRFVNDMNDETKHELLNKACHFESIECALHLLREGAKPDKDTPLWPLIKQCNMKSKEHVDILQNVAMYCNDEMKLHLLRTACFAGSAEFALYLLSEGVKPDATTPYWSLIRRGLCGGKGDVDLLKKVFIYLNDDRKQALFNAACYSGSEECVLYLLRAGVKPDQDELWSSLITGKGYKGDLDILKKVFRYMNEGIKLYLLKKACRSGSEECALYLLCEGVKPDKDTDLWSLVTGGSMYGKGDMDILKKVVIYLNHEMKVNLLNKACDSCSEECALYLLCEGVKPDKDTQLWTLITRRVMRGKGVVDVLKKVIIYMSDEMKLDLLHKACDSGSEECASYLLCVGVKPDKDTPLWSLITGGDWYCKGDVDVLKKVVIYLNNEINLDLLKKACDSESEECVLYLEHECAVVSSSI